MNSPTKRFIKQFIILTVGVILLGLYLFSGPLKSSYLSIFPIIYLNFGMISLLYFIMMIRAKNQREGKFPTSFTLAKSTRIILIFFCSAVYLLIYRKNALQIIAFIVFLYCLFSVFETITILRFFNMSKETRTQRIK